MPSSPPLPFEVPTPLGLRDVAPAQKVRGTADMLVIVVVGVLMVMCAIASPAVADTCANATVRVQNNSTGLSDCRAYEMVTPSYKEGFTVDAGAFTDEGLAAYTSTGDFAGTGHSSLTNPYLASRSATGWITTPLSPPGDTYDTGGQAASALSDDLHQSLWRMSRRDDPAGQSYYYRRDEHGVFTRIGPTDVTFIAGASADLSHIVFNHGFSGGSAITELYEYVGTRNPGPPRPVSVDNTGSLTPGDSCPRSTSEDGRVIVFLSGCDATAIQQVWARVAGSATVAVSGSECTRASTDPGGACNGPESADYAGAADDGSRIFFTTVQQLVNTDTDQTTDLYACDIPAGAPTPTGSANPCADLTRVSGPVPDAQVQSIAAVSDDGSRVYFVARGVLADNLGANDAAPVAGEDNLYLWTKDAAHPAGHTTFVTQFGDGDIDHAEMTPDARYLLLLTASRLVTNGPGTDLDDAEDLYRYDASTGAIVRISTATTGTDGNNTAFGVLPAAKAGITSDGSTIVFTTGEALTPSDTDGVGDVYEWHDGRVSLVGRGGGPWITPSGRDIFFVTDQPLTAADGDVNGDIYDARVGGGFDLSRPTPCSGSACRGPLSVTPNLGNPLSGWSDQSPPAPVVRGVMSLRVVTSAQRRRLVSTGRVILTVKANVAGTVRATAIATIAGRATAVASAHRTMITPGSISLKLTLSRKAQSQLLTKRKLAVKVSVRHSKVAQERAVTLKLVRARPSKRSGASHGRRTAFGGRA